MPPAVVLPVLVGGAHVLVAGASAELRVDGVHRPPPLLDILLAALVNSLGEVVPLQEPLLLVVPEEPPVVAIDINPQQLELPMPSIALACLPSDRAIHPFPVPNPEHFAGLRQCLRPVGHKGPSFLAPDPPHLA